MHCSKIYLLSVDNHGEHTTPVPVRLVLEISRSACLSFEGHDSAPPTKHTGPFGIDKFSEAVCLSSPILLY